MRDPTTPMHPSDLGSPGRSSPAGAARPPEPTAMMLPVQYVPPSQPASVALQVEPVQVEARATNLVPRTGADDDVVVEQRAFAFARSEADTSRTIDPFDPVDAPSSVEVPLAVTSRAGGSVHGSALGHAQTSADVRVHHRGGQNREGIAGRSEQSHGAEFDPVGGGGARLAMPERARGRAEVLDGACASAGGGMTVPPIQESELTDRGQPTEGARHYGRHGSRSPGRSYGDQRMAKSPWQRMAKPSAADGRAA